MGTSRVCYPTVQRARGRATGTGTRSRCSSRSSGRRSYTGGSTRTRRSVTIGRMRRRSGSVQSRPVPPLFCVTHLPLPSTTLRPSEVSFSSPVSKSGLGRRLDVTSGIGQVHVLRPTLEVGGPTSATPYSVPPPPPP